MFRCLDMKRRLEVMVAYFRPVLAQFDLFIPPSVNPLFLLLIGQILRVFYDRLVDDKDHSWFLSYLRIVMKEKLAADFDTLFAHLRAEQRAPAANQQQQTAAAAAPQGELTIEEVRRCFFGDYMEDNGEAQWGT